MRINENKDNSLPIQLYESNRMIETEEQNLNNYDGDDDNISKSYCKDIDIDDSDNLKIDMNQIDNAIYYVRALEENDMKAVIAIAQCIWPEWPFLDSKIGFVVDAPNSHKQNNIVGFIGYAYIQPMEISNNNNNNSNHMGWIADDFDFNDMKYRNNITLKKNYESLVKSNPNLKNNWNNLLTHVIHITQCGIDKKYRNKGLGTKLLTEMIESFPIGTKFGVEVECNNVYGIKLCEKCGFVIKRKVNDFYGDKRDAFKMILISKDSVIQENSDQNMNQINQLLINKICKEYNMKFDADHLKQLQNSSSQSKTNKQMLIANGLKYFCPNNWNEYLTNFQKEEVMDTDLFNLTEKDLFQLISKVGPRSRIRKWIEIMKQSNKD